MLVGAPLSVGDVVADKYRIDGILGQGGMATVFSAWHDELEQRVALKMLNADLSADPAQMKRFVREARSAARIQSEHVTKILDVGRVDDGRVFIVMEYLEGNDLARVLKTRGALPVAEVVQYLIEACHAIAVAHAMGVVHRDLKPGNLFLARHIDGSTCVKVLDFGIAKAFNTKDAGELTSANELIGSPYYMAPEQMASARDVDARADIWSLGVIAFRLLTNKLPFVGDNLPELARNIALEPPRSLRELRPDLPPPLESAILRCLEREASLRWADVGSFVQAIAPFGSLHVQPLVERVLRVGRPTEPIAGYASSTGERDEFPSSSSGPSYGTLPAPSTATVHPGAERRTGGRGTWIAVGVVLAATAFAGAWIAGSRARVAPANEPTEVRTPAAPFHPEPSAEVIPTSTPSSAATHAQPSASIVETSHAKPAATTNTKTSIKPATKPGGKKKDVWGWGE